MPGGKYPHSEPALPASELTCPVIIDAVGYLPFDTAAAALFLQLITARCETGLAIVAAEYS